MDFQHDCVFCRRDFQMENQFQSVLRFIDFRIFQGQDHLTIYSEIKNQFRELAFSPSGCFYQTFWMYCKKRNALRKRVFYP